MNLELLAVAEEHERVALIDQPDVAALTPHFGAAHVGFDGVVRPVGTAHEEPRAAADGLVARPDEHAAAVDARSVRPSGSTSTTSAPPSVPSKSSVHGSGGITRTRACAADAADGGLDEARRSGGGRDVGAVGADGAAEQIERPLRLARRRAANEVALVVVQLQRERLLARRDRAAPRTETPAPARPAAVDGLAGAAAGAGVVAARVRAFGPMAYRCPADPFIGSSRATSSSRRCGHRRPPVTPRSVRDSSPCRSGPRRAIVRAGRGRTQDVELAALGADVELAVGQHRRGL